MVDYRDYVENIFRKAEDFAERELVEVTIKKVQEGKFDKLGLTFDDGTLLSFNAGNGKRLASAYGYDTDEWLDKAVELSVGTVLFKNEPTPSVILKPITARPPKPAKPDPNPIDDDIPFE